MKQLAHNVLTDGRTWVNPRGLDRLTEKARFACARFIVVGTRLVATTDPFMNHEGLASSNFDRDKAFATHDTDLFPEPFASTDIRLLRRKSLRSHVMIEFAIPDDCEMRPQSDGRYVPGVAAGSTDLVMGHVRTHPAVQGAFPRGIQLVLSFSNNYGDWICDDGAFFHYVDQKSLSREQGQSPRG